MKNKMKISLFTVIFILLFVAAVENYSLESKKMTIYSRDIDFLDMSGVSWNTSDYINFTGPLIDASGGKGLKLFRIFIDETNENYTWAKTAAENEWCTGSGTYSDPYIIENLYINGQGSGGMIFVKNSKKYFIISNCWFNFSGPYEYDVGVCLQFTENGTIDNNIIMYTFIGITIEHIGSYNNTISNNIMISDHTTATPHGVGGMGILVSSGASNTSIINNKIRNYYSAITVGEGVQVCSNNTIDRNYAENNIHSNDYSGYPIILDGVSYSRITRNILAGVFAFGIFEINEINCVGNIIENNQVVVNQTLEFGPETAGTLSLTNLKVSAGSKNLITLENCHYNYIAHNKMILPRKEGVIYGYDFILVIGLVSVISVILIRKVIKK